MEGREMRKADSGKTMKASGLQEYAYRPGLHHQGDLCDADRYLRLLGRQQAQIKRHLGR